ncbi:uncharacterized protein EDB91DRAFT_1245272 [Suillus paluster]|uniref:uncharacterized protein n=1 Tax=Suillus paluster TaxID=48578 RepID=UPI001B87E448|nr:uncharacterized protein EDB91DRAFT_1245272 [Suillus paluster]KAG1747785.1 hypothetical protein EDB91DRAFT_1245272 [Suillus paluster]
MEENLKSQASEVREALSSRISKILGNSSEMGVLKDGQVVTKLLHKARMRISVHLQICLATPDHTTFTNTSISEYEIDQATLTIAHAMVNPINVDWDVDRYADRVKLSPPNRDGSATSELERLKKYFSEAVLSKISTPATIVDRHGRILMVYLPNILSPARLEYVNNATSGLRNSLLDTLLPISDQKKSWRDDGFVVPEGQERLIDPLVTSESYNSKEVQKWLEALTTSELLWNSITAAVAPELFESGTSAFSKVVKEGWKSLPTEQPSATEILVDLFTF